MSVPTHPLRPVSILDQVIAAVREAGRMLEAEFTRPGGPRFSDHVTAPVDHEMELFLRRRLLTLLPARFVGEEAGVLAGDGSGFCWVVDPHDGTRAFLEGRRGSAVSVALLRQGQPVLGVVFAPLSPDRGPDLIAWAEGMEGLLRNGVRLTQRLDRRDLTPSDVVFLNHGAWQRPVWNSTACAPARFMPLPSIAYRLARVAAGDGVATVTLRPVNAHDIAAGHALLSAMGGVLVTEDGTPVTYDEQGDSRTSAGFFGGMPAAVAVLRARTWRGSTEPRREPRIVLDWPRVPESTALCRAAGALLGLAIGGGVRVAEADRGRQAGQPQEATERAFVLARVLAAHRSYAREAAEAADQAWCRSLDPGLAPGAAPGSFADTAAMLLRAVPIGIWAGSEAHAAEVALADSAGADATIGAGCAAVAAAVAAGIGGGAPAAMLQAAMTAAGSAGAVVRAVLEQAMTGEPVGPASPALRALHTAFVRLTAGTGVPEAMPPSLARERGAGPAAGLAGALIGAAHGRDAFPVDWVMAVLTCRPASGMHVARPRPEAYWLDDVLDLAEALLLDKAHLR